MVWLVRIGKAFRYRVYPTSKQIARLGAWEGALRFLWNLALEQRLMGLVRPHDDRRYPTAFDQINQLTELRAELPWLADVPRNVCAQLLVELDRAWQRCFAKLARAPRWKRRGDVYKRQVLAVARGGDVHDADVHAEPTEDLLLLDIRNLDGDEEIELRAAQHEIGLAALMGKKSALMLAADERDGLPTRESPEAYGVCLPRQDSLIVRNRSERTKGSPSLPIRLVGCLLYTSPADHVRHDGHRLLHRLEHVDLDLRNADDSVRRHGRASDRGADNPDVYKRQP